MRHVSFVLLLLGLPAMAAAQHTWREEPPPPPLSALGPIGLPLSPIGLPLPSIGFSLPPIGMPLLPTGGTPPAPRQPRHDDRMDPRRHGPRSQPPVVYMMLPYPWMSAPPAPTVMPQPSVSVVTAQPPLPDTGSLRFEVEPANLLQLFVDGVYVGTPGDLRNEINLPPGLRRIEFRAPGHQALIVDAQIVAQRTITYRGELNALAHVPFMQRDTQTPTTAPAPVPAGSRTLYVIPGCYLGNVRPEEVKLPAGCDISRVTTYTP